MKKLLIADAGEEFRAVLQESLQDTYQVRVCREGNETFQALRSFQPDVMILDMLLPGIDGVTLLQKMEQTGLHPTVLAVTRFASDYMMDAVERLGVGYLIVKPCEADAVAARLEDLLRRDHSERTQEVTEPDLNTMVNNVLRELRIPTHPRGFACLREALLLTLQEPEQQVTKTLYPAVGKICGGNTEQVEHAIRRLIKQAWACRDEKVWNRCLRSLPDAAVKCPGNKAFISAVANYILEDYQRSCTYFTHFG